MRSWHRDTLNEIIEEEGYNVAAGVSLHFTHQETAQTLIPVKRGAPSPQLKKKPQRQLVDDL